MGAMSELYDVIAVNIKTKAERMIAEQKDYSNAEAIIEIAVRRRGAEEEFFTSKPHPYKLSQEK